MPPEELVPVNILAILPDTGGSVLVAYREELGFNADGWLGFAIAAGAAPALVSHMLGVREEQRGTRPRLASQAAPELRLHGRSPLCRLDI